MPKEGNRSFTLSFDPQIQEEFKIECIKNEKNMSDVLMGFMKIYSKKSKIARSKNQLRA